MSEYKAFKQLIRVYKSITRKDIAKLVDEGYSWNDIKKELTGFGSNTSCLLCRDAKSHKYNNLFCENCDWIKLTGDRCNNSSSKNHKTYEAIGQAETTEDLYQAYQDRANYMERVLNENQLKYVKNYRHFKYVKSNYILKDIAKDKKALENEKNIGRNNMKNQTKEALKAEINKLIDKYPPKSFHQLLFEKLKESGFDVKYGTLSDGSGSWVNIDYGNNKTLAIGFDENDKIDGIRLFRSIYEKIWKDDVLGEHIKPNKGRDN